MGLRNIVQIGETCLLQKSINVSQIKSSKTKIILDDLIDTHLQAKGIGLAAPQICENVALFVTELPVNVNRSPQDSDELRVYINPEIVEFSEECTVLYESCLSISTGDLYLPVSRPKQITIDAFDSKARKFRLRCDGLLARVIQHEYDHLQGTLFIEKAMNYREGFNLENYRKFTYKSEPLIEARKLTLKDIQYF